MIPLRSDFLLPIFQMGTAPLHNLALPGYFHFLIQNEKMCEIDGIDVPSVPFFVSSLREKFLHVHLCRAVSKLSDLTKRTIPQHISNKKEKGREFLTKSLDLLLLLVQNDKGIRKYLMQTRAIEEQIISPNAFILLRSNDEAHKPCVLALVKLLSVYLTDWDDNGDDVYWSNAVPTKTVCFLLQHLQKISRNWHDDYDIQMCIVETIERSYTGNHYKIYNGYFNDLITGSLNRYLRKQIILPNDCMVEIDVTLKRKRDFFRDSSDDDSDTTIVDFRDSISALEIAIKNYFTVFNVQIKEEPED